MTKNERNKKIVFLIRETIKSLDSHLEDCLEEAHLKIKDKKVRERYGDRKFHIECVQDYAVMVKELADLL